MPFHFPQGVNAEEIVWVKERSGLTWDQLGKVFGVSRRAVHMWANGGRMSESNSLWLQEVSEVVRTLVDTSSGGLVPESVRARLLEVGSDGTSIVGRLRRIHSSRQSWGAPFGPEYFIDVVREGQGKD